MFEQALRERGWVTGKNLVIEYRYAEGKYDRLPALAAELVRLEPRVIVAVPTAANPAIPYYYEATQVVGQALHVTLKPVVEVRRVEELENAFSMIATARPGALVVLADRFLLAHRRQIVEFAAARRLPGMYPYREYVDAGRLMSYAPSNIELFRGAAIYVDKILKGAKPGDLPVQEPTKFELVINLKTARVLGVTLPQSILVGAELVQ